MATNKPFIMASPVKINDHDFNVAPRHSFIMSVYAIFEIEDTGHYDDHRRVSWRGPTQVVVRSGYHERACTYNHAIDVGAMLDDRRFDKWTRDGEGNLKRVLHIGGDNGPDEAMKNESVMRSLYWLKMLSFFKTFPRHS